MIHQKTTPYEMGHLPLQIGQTGRIRGRAFTAIGHVHCQNVDTPSDYWDEWFIIYKDESAGFLLLENGEYVLFTSRRTIPDTHKLPSYNQVQIGDRIVLEGYEGSVYLKESVQITALSGQLPYYHATLNTVRRFYDVDLGGLMATVEDEGLKSIEVFIAKCSINL